VGLKHSSMSSFTMRPVTKFQRRRAFGFLCPPSRLCTWSSATIISKGVVRGECDLVQTQLRVCARNCVYRFARRQHLLIARERRVHFLLIRLLAALPSSPAPSPSPARPCQRPGDIDDVVT
jgi:hypothetical protein